MCDAIFYTGCIGKVNECVCCVCAVHLPVAPATALHRTPIPWERDARPRARHSTGCRRCRRRRRLRIVVTHARSLVRSQGGVSDNGRCERMFHPAGATIKTRGGVFGRMFCVWFIFDYIALTSCGLVCFGLGVSCQELIRARLVPGRQMLSACVVGARRSARSAR